MILTLSTQQIEALKRVHTWVSEAHRLLSRIGPHYSATLGLGIAKDELQSILGPIYQREEADRKKRAEDDTRPGLTPPKL